MKDNEITIYKNGRVYRFRYPTDDLHFCEWLAEHVGVGAVPGSCFFKENVHHLIRFHFAKRDDTLNAALDRLSELDSKAKGYNNGASQ